MRRMIKGARGGWALSLLLTIGIAGRAGAIYLDEDQNISLRARLYSQGSVRLENSSGDTTPRARTGQLVQHRNFFNPEMDAKLTSYTTWMKDGWMGWLAPDDFSFRVAGRAFYDGIYDYGSGQFWDTARQVNSTYPFIQPVDSQGNPIDRHAFVLQGDRVNLKGGAPSAKCTADPSTSQACLEGIFPGAAVQNPRTFYAHRGRLNELYLNYSKGPFFMRLGRQAISWGESDTIALLDANNPFDITQGPPGAFQDVDEARIPLWTVRTSFNLFDSLGPLSSGFVEAYWVPGNIETSTGDTPILTASPYSPAGGDPQSIAGPLAQVVLFDHIPQKKFSSSRYGFRVQTVVARDHTASAWYYTTFPTQPVALSDGSIASPQGSIFTTETLHNKLINVVGLADTFYFEPLDGIIRLEGEYFNHEPGFIPQISLGAGNPLVNFDAQLLSFKGSVPYADYLRWETGYDRFFFIRPLNPSNSFVFASAIVGAWNMSEGGQIPIYDSRGNLVGNVERDFYASGQRKSGGQGTKPGDFVQQDTLELFGQVHMQTDYLHGRLSPEITFIQNKRGTFAALPAITYRWNDSLLLTLKGTVIGGAYQQLGFYRDRDQISLRATYQLN